MLSAIEAEQALLGAILCDPVGQHHVLDLVEPGDMLRPWHGQVLAAMRRLRERGALPSATDVYRELQTDPDLPRSAAMDAVPLAGLMEAAPRPEHAGAYSAIVVEAEIRRRLQLAGSRLVQAAEPADLEAALAQVGRARADIAGCAVRWAALPVSRRTEPGQRPDLSREKPRPRPGAASPTTRLRGNSLSIHNTAVDALPARAVGHEQHATTSPGGRADQKTAARLGGTVRQRDRLALAASAAALRGLIDEPSHLAAVGRWLCPGHFAGAIHGELYTLLRDMHAAGQAIDPVTVSWEASRRGMRTDPGRLAGGIGSFATADAREVHRLGTLAQITHAGNGLQADAAKPAQALGSLLQATTAQLEALLNAPQPSREPVPPASPARALSRMAIPAADESEREAAL